MKKQSKMIEAFNKFNEEAKAYFTKLSKKKQRYKELDEIYSLNICPSGRNGGIDDKLIEIFYGNRAYGVRRQFNSNKTISNITEIEKGASLVYNRLDNGNVICFLYPAKSENMSPVEDFIIIDYIVDVNKIHKKAKTHFRFLQAYMEKTCLEGKMTCFQMIDVMYLKNCKKYVKDKILQESKCWEAFKYIVKWGLTVALSGILVTYCNETQKNKQVIEEQDKVREILYNIDVTSKSISNKLAISNSLIKQIINNMAEARTESSMQKIVKDMNRITVSVDKLNKQVCNINDNLEQIQNNNIPVTK